MRILGIESSCDDTSAALVEMTDASTTILAEKTASQIEVHKKYGGVVPEVAARCHAENILPVIETVLEGQSKPEAIAVTSGPGLLTGLLVGVEVAKNLSYLWNIPLIRTNHIAGHIHSVLLAGEGKTNATHIQFPALCLVVSGGHTELIYMKSSGEYERIGKTRDDAAGECFDKTAKLLGFEYPGGPKISKVAKDGNPKAIPFPRPMLHENNFDFSFAGLKTAVLYWLRDHEKNYDVADVCASIEAAIVETLVTKTIRAAEHYQPKNIILAGGVAANPSLRTQLAGAITAILPTTPLLIPELKYCMDNAAMIAAAGYYTAKKTDYTPWHALQADPNWEVA